MNNIKDKLIEIAKKAIADNTIIEDDCIVDFDCNDFDHICEEIADNVNAEYESILSNTKHKIAVLTRALEIAITNTSYSCNSMYDDYIQQAKEELGCKLEELKK